MPLNLCKRKLYDLYFNKNKHLLPIHLNFLFNNSIYTDIAKNYQTP